MSNWSSEFKTGFFIGLGVGAALIVISFATGVVRR
jgi:hypothetical protein